MANGRFIQFVRSPEEEDNNTTHNEQKKNKCQPIVAVPGQLDIHHSH